MAFSEKSEGSHEAASVKELLQRAFTKESVELVSEGLSFLISMVPLVVTMNRDWY